MSLELKSPLFHAHVPTSTTMTPHDRSLPRLRILSGSRKETEHSVPPTGCTVGRSRKCTVRLSSLKDSLVSGVHLIIGQDPGGSWWIEDNHSTNGTWLDGRRLTERIPIPVDNEFTMGCPGHEGAVRFYIAFPELRRKAREGDVPMPRVADYLGDPSVARGPE